MTSPHHFPSGCFPLYNGTKAQAGETISCVVEMIGCGLGRALASVVGMISALFLLGYSLPSLLPWAPWISSDGMPIGDDVIVCYPFQAPGLPEVTV